jgi:hypothetical protein
LLCCAFRHFPFVLPVYLSCSQIMRRVMRLVPQVLLKLYTQLGFLKIKSYLLRMLFLKISSKPIIEENFLLFQKL